MRQLVQHLRRTLFFNYPKAMEYIRGGPLRDANWAADGDEYGGDAGATGYHPEAHWPPDPTRTRTAGSTAITTT